jgi:hypothetical protein
MAVGDAGVRALACGALASLTMAAVMMVMVQGGPMVLVIVMMMMLLLVIMAMVVGVVHINGGAPFLA